MDLKHFPIQLNTDELLRPLCYVNTNTSEYFLASTTIIKIMELYYLVINSYYHIQLTLPWKCLAFLDKFFVFKITIYWIYHSTLHKIIKSIGNLCFWQIGSSCWFICLSFLTILSLYNKGDLSVLLQSRLHTSVQAHSPAPVLLPTGPPPSNLGTCARQPINMSFSMFLSLFLKNGKYIIVWGLSNK